MLGIVIVAYKHPELTVAFVNNVLPRIDVPWRAVVVNLASSPDETNAISKKCPNENVFFKAVSENLGYACGNNLGVKLLEQRFSDITEILFSNTDIEIPAGENLSLLLRELAAKKGGAIGPRIVGLNGVQQGPFSKLPSIWRKIASKLLPFLRRSKLTAHLSQVKDDYSSTFIWLQGSFVVVDRTAFDECEGYDERTFLYGEELLLAIRMKTHGWLQLYSPLLTVVHSEGASTCDTVSLLERDHIASMSHRVYFQYYAGCSRLTLLLYDIVEWCYVHFLWRFQRK